MVAACSGRSGLPGNSALRLGLEPSSHFAALRDFLRHSEFNETTICRRAGVAGLHEFLFENRKWPSFATESDGLGLLIRLFLIGEQLSVQVLEAAIPAPALEAMEKLGLLIEAPADKSQFYASVALSPMGSLFIVSDRWTTLFDKAPELQADFVYPAISADSAQFTMNFARDPCENFLELCSGAGAAALEAAAHASHVWAVDITERSTQAAEFNRLLNGLDNLTTLQADLYESLGGLTFDRILAHPPYMPVLNPAELFYGGGVDGEQVTRRVVAGLPRYLRPGGRFYGLVQGSDRDSGSFEQRVRDWLGEEQSEFDVIIVVKGTQKPSDTAMHYAVKANSGGQTYRQMRDALRTLGVQRMIYGWLIMQRREDDRPVFTTRRSVGPHSGREEIAWLLKWETAAVKPQLIEGLGEVRPVAVPFLELHTVYRWKEGDLRPDQFTLHADHPFCVECQVQPWVSFLLPQCDGKSSVRRLLEFCKENHFVHPETPLAEFAKMLMVLMSRGLLEVEGFELPKT